MNKFIECKKRDCSAYRVTGVGKGICIALSEPCKNNCVFYKKDPDGSIQKQIEKDIKNYYKGG